MRFFVLFITLILFIFYFSDGSWAYNDDVTHPELTESAISVSVIETYLKGILRINEGLAKEIEGRQIEEWIKYGARMEDSPMCRASNHFHNPRLLWQDAGLTDTHWLATGRCFFSNYLHDARISALTWGTGYLSNEQKDDDIIAVNRRDWNSAREYFYAYLTGRNFKGTLLAPDNETRRQYLAESMHALGQVLHLLQDMAVPAHVRNDFSQGHTFFMSGWESPQKWWGNPFEKYVARNNDRVWFDAIDRSNISNPWPPFFWDTDDSGQDVDPYVPSNQLGLSEYTQINFLSEYSMFTEDFPYPGGNMCEVVYNPTVGTFPSLDRQYISSTNGHPGEQIRHLAVISYLDYFRNAYLPNISTDPLPLALDANCYDEYASHLIPRAIGYSADLLDYFFRGRLRVSAVPVVRNNNIYAIVLLIKNVTPTLFMKNGESTEEELSNGKFCLTVRCTPPGGNPDGSDDKFVQTFGFTDQNELQYELDSGRLEYDEDEIFRYDQDAKFFFYPAEPVPVPTAGPEGDLEPLTCILAFRGTLGNEKDAVIAKLFSLGEQRKFIEEWDKGKTGNYPWHHTAGDENHDNGKTINEIENEILIKENIRFEEQRGQRFNESFIYFTYVDSPHKVIDPENPNGIPVTRDTYLQFKIDDLSINEDPPAPEGYTAAYQYLRLDFNSIFNGQPVSDHLALKFTREGQGVDLPHVYDVTYDFQSGVINIANIYNMFQQMGITVPEPFYLQAILLDQHLDNIDQPSSVKHRQRMEVDFISIIEGHNE